MAKATKQKAQPNPNRNRPNVWGMIQNIVIASINRGQLPIFGAVALVGLIILKMPSEKVSELAFKVLEHFTLFHLLGWILSVVLIFLWFITFRMLRKSHLAELARVVEAKDKLTQLHQEED